MNTFSLPDFPSLTHDRRTDVCIIGAGIAGLTTAYLLTRAGKRVTIIESEGIGSGETSRTTAHLTAALDHGYTTIASIHGEDHARIVAESQSSAIERIETIVKGERIACDFERVDGYLFVEDLTDADDRHMIEEELEVTHTVGLTTTRLARVPIPDAGLWHALCYPDQAQFHPIKYIAGLVRAIVRDGGEIYGGTRVVGVEDGVPAVVTTQQGHRIVADEVVIATNTPINAGFALHVRQAPYRSYVIGFRIPAGSVPHVLLWDTGEPYHYVRVQSNSAPDGDDILIVGGEDHQAGQADDTHERFARLEQWTRGRFAMAGDIVSRWSGQVVRSDDALAYLGRSPGDTQHLYVITGDCCNGITNATIGAMIISDLIMGKPNPWAECYDPRRLRRRAVEGLERVV